jgi:putative transposase
VKRKCSGIVGSPISDTADNRLSRNGGCHEEVEVYRVADRSDLEGREAGVALSELTSKHGISRATYFNWRAKYGGVSVSELKRMKELEAENARLKRMYAELALENAAIKDLLSRKL